MKIAKIRKIFKLWKPAYFSFVVQGKLGNDGFESVEIKKLDQVFKGLTRLSQKNRKDEFFDFILSEISSDISLYGENSYIVREMLEEVFYKKKSMTKSNSSSVFRVSPDGGWDMKMSIRWRK